MVVFFVGNYITLATTVKLPAATRFLASMWICVGALLILATGLVFELMAFWQATRGFGRPELEKLFSLAPCACTFRSEELLPPARQTVQVPAKLTQRYCSTRGAPLGFRWWLVRLPRLSETLKGRRAGKVADALVI